MLNKFKFGTLLVSFAVFGRKRLPSVHLSVRSVVTVSSLSSNRSLEQLFFSLGLELLLCLLHVGWFGHYWFDLGHKRDGRRHVLLLRHLCQLHPHQRPYHYNPWWWEESFYMGQNLAKYIFFHICIYRQMKTKSKRPADFTLLRGCHDDVRREGERGLKVIAGLKCHKRKRLQRPCQCFLIAMTWHPMDNINQSVSQW